MLLQQPLVVLAGIRTAAIGVRHQPFIRQASRHRHLQDIDYQRLLIRSLIDPPTICREYRSSTAASYNQPSAVGGQRLRLYSKKWYGDYIDANGRPRCVPLARDRTAAQQMLAALVRKAELGKAGIHDPHEGIADGRSPSTGPFVDIYPDCLDETII